MLSASNSFWGISLEEFGSLRSCLEQFWEFSSGRLVAQLGPRHGLKTQVQVIHWQTEIEPQAIDDEEIPFSMTKLKERLELALNASVSYAGFIEQLKSSSFSHPRRRFFSTSLAL